MTRRTIALALSAVLLSSSAALARSVGGPDQPAQPAQQDQPAASTAQAKPAASAVQVLKNPVAAVEAINQSMRASEQRNQEAVAAMNQAQGEAKPAPASKPGGGKVIYGDIIIYK